MVSELAASKTVKQPPLTSGNVSVKKEDLNIKVKKEEDTDKAPTRTENGELQGIYVHVSGIQIVENRTNSDAFQSSR